MTGRTARKKFGPLFGLMLGLAVLAVLVPFERSGSSLADDALIQRGAGPLMVSVPFVTNRRRDPNQSAVAAYTGERGEPHFGHCQVEFTPIPIVSELAPKVSFYVPSETKKLRVAEETDDEVFWEQVAHAVKQTSTRSVVVFVHGYNYDFGRTCRMAAELQRILEGQAAVLMFSWPSNGRPTDYIPDQADVEWSVPFLASVLQLLGDRVGPDRVQVMAHSLGSRGIIFALAWLHAEPLARPATGSLVLVAPDFDSQTFVERLPRLVPMTDGITLYASDNDAALKLSNQLHRAPRLGEAGEYLTVAEGMETIDVSPPGRYQILGHEYFYYHPQVADDLRTLFSTGKRAADRTGLRARRRGRVTYWELAAEMAP